jgi:hypothetical protein
MVTSRWWGVCAVSVVLGAGCADTPDPVSPAAPALAKAGPQAPGPGADFTLNAPVFGLSIAPDGSLMAASGAGLSEIRRGAATLVASLPGASGLAHLGRGNALAVTGAPAEGAGAAPGSRTLFRVSPGKTRTIADLDAFEHAVNPDQVWNPGDPDSNPFNLALLGGGEVLVADAAANALLVVSAGGGVDWVAVLPPKLLPFMGNLIPVQPVATSVAVGPDGAYYVGELTGFPGTPGNSLVWRIEPGTRQTVCPSASCAAVIAGLTSVVNLAFGPDGTLYVVELDEAGWLATQGAGGTTPAAGGAVKACDVGAGTCSVVASGLDLPAGIAVAADGTVWISENESIPGVAHVHALGS